MSKTFFCCFVLVCMPVQAGQVNEREWTLQKDENGIKIYSRVHKSGYEMTKLEAVVDYDLHQLLAINTDVSRLKDWMDSAKGSELVLSVSPREYVVRMTWDIPAPFYDRDSVARSVITQDLPTKEVLLSYKTEKGLVATTLEYVRMDEAIGYWRYTPVSRSRTKVEYTCLTMPGGELVPFWANMKAVEAPWNTFRNMLSVLESGKYKNTALDFIKNN